MKRPGMLMAAFLGLALLSCSRDADDLIQNNNATLEGGWRMVLVKDNASSFIYTKPGAITGDVDINFVAVTATKGFITGKTPSQEIEAEYEMGSPGFIRIPVITYGKIAETSLGIDFLHSFISADTYSFEPDGKLRIHTGKKTLYFIRN